MAEFWSNDDRGYRIRLWIDQVSQNTQSNSSQVRVRLALLNTTTTFTGYSCSAFVDLNGQRLNWSDTISMGYNQTLMLIDRTITVNHNADGTKSFGLMASFTGGGGWSPNTLTIGGNSFTLTPIARSSSISIGNAVIGQPVTITINRQNPNFKHTIRYWWGDKKGVVATDVDTSAVWNVPNDLANDVPNASVGQGTVFVDTYSNGKLMGTQSVTFMATVPDTMKPTLSRVTLSDASTIAQSLIPNPDTFIQVISNIKVAFDGASGSYGSTITGYRAEIVGKNQATNVNGGTLGIMNYSGSITVRASVVDSRGRWSASKDIQVKVLEYFAPALSFSIARTGSTSSTLTVTRNAKVAALSVNGVQKNTMTLTFKVARLGTEAYAPDNGPASGTWSSISTLVNSQANLAGNYLANQSWVVIGALEDKFTRTEFAANVATESVVFSYDRFGVGINKIRERGALDVKGDIYANDQPIQQYQLTQSNGMLNRGGWDQLWNVQATTIDWRDGSYTDHPLGKGGPWGLFQNYWLDSWKGAQFFTEFGQGRHFVRYYNNAREWKPSEWKEFAFTDHANLINTGWQPAGVAGSYYKRVGDVLTIKYDFMGDGGDKVIANIPSNIFTAPQAYMYEIAGWGIIGGTGNIHVQINKGGSSLHALQAHKNVGYRGQLTIMI
nr:MAG TPA: protein of unknown function DUF859 [Caudoviricetes sp.]